MTSRVLNIAAGASLGLLFGTLIGLSITPVVASVLGALAAGALIFLSLAERKGSREPVFDDLKLLRITSFGIAATLAVLAGTTIRAHGVLGQPEIISLFDDLKRIGVKEEDARKALLQRVSSSEPSETAQKQAAPVIFGAGAGKCSTIRPDRYGTANEAIQAFRAAGEPWSLYAERASSLPEGELLNTLKVLHALNCGSQP